MSSHFNKTVFESQCMYPLEIVYEVDKKLTIKLFFFKSIDKLRLVTWSSESQHLLFLGKLSSKIIASVS